MAMDYLKDKANEYCPRIRLLVLVLAQIDEDIPRLIAGIIEILGQRVGQHCLTAARMTCKPQESIGTFFEPRDEQTVAANPLTCARNWLWGRFNIFRDIVITKKQHAGSFQATKDLSTISD